MVALFAGNMYCAQIIDLGWWCSKAKNGEFYLRHYNRDVAAALH